MSARELLATMESAAAARAPLALGTLVRTAGSTYRRAGARLLVTADGRPVGLISGGCLEPHIAEAAREVLETGVPRRLHFDMTSEHDGLAGFGLGCEGALDVVLERLEPWRLEPEARRLLCGLWYGSTPAAAVTVFDAPAPRQLGTAVLDGRGVFGGPAPLAESPLLASAARDLAHDVLAQGRSTARTLYLPEGSIGCFVDVVQPTFHLTVFGAGPDAYPLVAFARELDWRVTVVDHRPALCDPARFPGAERVLHAQPEAVAAVAPTGPHTAFVVMTHNYSVDMRLLPRLLPLETAYVGILGPKRRGDRLLKDLADEFVPTEEQRARLYSPVGLKLGGDSPAAIALAIVAEIQSVLARCDAQSLRRHDGPIHEAEREPLGALADGAAAVPAACAGASA